MGQVAAGEVRSHHTNDTKCPPGRKESQQVGVIAARIGAGTMEVRVVPEEHTLGGRIALRCSRPRRTNTSDWTTYGWRVG